MSSQSISCIIQVAVCGSVLQCVAVCRSVLQESVSERVVVASPDHSVLVASQVLQDVAVCCSVLQESVLQGGEDS